MGKSVTEAPAQEEKPVEAGQKEDISSLSLVSKLAAIGKAVGVMEKDGKNAQQGYAFIEYAAIAGKIRDLFAEYGVIVFPEVINREKDVVRSSSGSVGYHYNLDMRFTALNGDDRDDKIVALWQGEATDYGDKGINKAETSGTKYFIMRLLNISEKGDDNDSNTPPNQAPDKATPQAQPAKPAAPAAPKPPLKDINSLPLTDVQLELIQKNADNPIVQAAMSYYQISEFKDLKVREAGTIIKRMSEEAAKGME